MHNSFETGMECALWNVQVDVPFVGCDQARRDMVWGGWLES